MRWILVTVLALGLAPALGGCEDEDEEGLGADHPGWGDPGCFGSGCHDRDETHNSDLQPYECVECHGKNGAPLGHGGNTPCATCHGQPHGNQGFPDPDSCEVCH